MRLGAGKGGSTGSGDITSTPPSEAVKRSVPANCKPGVLKKKKRRWQDLRFFMDKDANPISSRIA